MSRTLFYKRRGAMILQVLDRGQELIVFHFRHQHLELAIRVKMFVVRGLVKTEIIAVFFLPTTGCNILLCTCAHSLGELIPWWYSISIACCQKDYTLFAPGSVELTEVLCTYGNMMRVAKMHTSSQSPECIIRTSKVDLRCRSCRGMRQVYAALERVQVNDIISDRKSSFFYKKISDVSSILFVFMRRMPASGAHRKVWCHSERDAFVGVNSQFLWLHWYISHYSYSSSYNAWMPSRKALRNL